MGSSQITWLRNLMHFKSLYYTDRSDGIKTCDLKSCQTCQEFKASAWNMSVDEAARLVQLRHNTFPRRVATGFISRVI